MSEMSICDYLPSCDINNPLLWRYVTEYHKDEDGATTNECFYLRDGEDYISLYHSNREYYEPMVRSLHRIIPMGKTKPAIYLSFDCNYLLKDLNKKHKRIAISDRKYPHIGMDYLFDVEDEMELLEVTTTILELSEFFQRNESGEILRVQE